MHNNVYQFALAGKVPMPVHRYTNLLLTVYNVCGSATFGIRVVLFPPECRVYPWGVPVQCERREGEKTEM